jgi:hypothetical protein
VVRSKVPETRLSGGRLRDLSHQGHGGFRKWAYDLYRRNITPTVKPVESFYAGFGRSGNDWAGMDE